MPNFDKSGPSGQGPMTGRGAGPCAGTNNENVSRPMGRGMGRGMGMGRGGVINNSPISLDEEEKMLENRVAEIRKLKKDSK